MDAVRRELTRDRTIELVPRDRILRREGGQGKKYFCFLVQLTTRRIIGNHTRLTHTLLKVLPEQVLLNHHYMAKSGLDYDMK